MAAEKTKNSPEELKKQIRAIKEEIQRIKDRMEQPGRDLEPTVTKADLKALHMARERLAQAKEALQAAGAHYPADDADRRATELLDNLQYMNKLTFEIGGYFGGYQTYTIERTDSAEKLIARLKELHVEEWMPEYWPDRFGVVVCDGTQWCLKIEFSNGHPAWESHGSNSYPYNFDAFRKLFDHQESTHKKRM